MPNCSIPFCRFAALLRHRLAGPLKYRAKLLDLSCRPEDNHHGLGRLFYAASTMFCTPCSLAQDVGLGLGNQVGTARLTALLNEAGIVGAAGKYASAG